jgi:processive 1,2-diacylglycerol beta-glucosyltransferase
MAIKTQRKKRVLILSASAGAGHLRAADALLKEFQNHSTVECVEHWDMLKYTTKAFSYVYSKMYLDLVNSAPKVLGWVYDSTDTPWKGEKRRLAFEKFNSRPFLKEVQKYGPDLIVCTHFTPSNLMGYLFEKEKVRIEPAIVVTDLDCHAMWLSRIYQWYFVALDETRVYLEKLGIASDRIVVSGIPIDPSFRQHKSQAAMRQKLGLHKDKFTLLVSAGGFGVGPVEGIIKELLTLKHPAQIVAIAGKSSPLKGKLDELAAHHRGKVSLHPVGFTTQMDEYMAAADILLSKPGGLTTSEAMARGLPMCIVNPIPGQEERNSDHLLEAGVAIRCNNPPTLAYKIERLMVDPEKLPAMRRAAVKFGRPHAASTIVQTLL